ncbi:MAG TPA: MOSC domain-containing protein [Dehalococcoidia bacterium]|nr:MOSC domain-containing protein [Dehalococcoidia bacterium]
MEGRVEAVSVSPAHTVAKDNQSVIRLLAGLGVEGDAHLGKTVQHLHPKKQNPAAPNLRQVHLIHAELHDELRAGGFDVAPGQMGENVTTRGLDLLGLPRGTRLRLGPAAVIEITGLRDPCRQLNGIQDGLLNACISKDEDGNLVRKAGIMAIVVEGGEVHPNDPIQVELPTGPYEPLAPV